MKMGLLAKQLVAEMFLLIIYCINGENIGIDEQYKKEGVVPDVLDQAPTSYLTVQYNNENVKFAEMLTPEQVKDAPNIVWGFDSRLDATAFYTLAMIDADGSNETSTPREFLHWLLVNIPGYEFRSGQTLAAYIGALPPKNTGVHRYVFTVYKQPKAMAFEEAVINDTTIEGRKGFALRKFALKYRLVRPYLGNMFKANYDDYVSKFYQQRALKPLSFV